MKNKLILLLLPLLVLSYSCDSISDNVRNQAENTKKSIQLTKNLVERNDSIYNVYLKTVGSVAEYSKSEKLEANFDEALKTLRTADTLYARGVMPLLEKDESTYEPNILSHLKRVKTLISDAVIASEYPKKRLTLLSGIENNVEKYKSTSDKLLSASGTKLNQLKGFAKPYYVNYPKREKDISADIKLGENYLNIITTYSDSINSNYNRKQSNQPYDLTILADSYNGIVDTSSKLVKYDATTKNHLKELDKSYTKILKDMKVRFYVEVGRTSWDSYSDYNTDTNYTYPMREVDEETFKYFDGLSDNVILASESGYGKDSPTVKIDKSKWNALKINPVEKYDGGDDDSEFWLNNAIAKYYHNYIIEDNGKIEDQSVWVEVDEDTFYDNLEHLGMSISSKPLGYFEDEVIEEATPAGMTYVDNPKYGEWKKDSNGESFWSFYGKYMFLSHMMGGNSFSRNQYNDYDRNYRNSGRNYYGSNGNHTYGTRGTSYTNTKSYANSNYKKSYAGSTRSEFGHSNLKKSYRTQSTSGRTQTSSSRTGSARRGGGPGGGGK